MKRFILVSLVVVAPFVALGEQPRNTAAQSAIESMSPSTALRDVAQRAKQVHAPTTSWELTGLTIQLIPPIVALVAVIVTAIVAVRGIRKTAEESRLSNIHAELFGCLHETVAVHDQILRLLNDVARKAVYARLPEEKITETAYERYWRELGRMSEGMGPIRARQKLLFPKSLSDCLRDTVKRINNAREAVRDVEPQDNVYPDTSTLKRIVDEAIEANKAFVGEARKHLGTPRLGPLVAEDDLIKGPEMIDKNS